MEVLTNGTSPSATEKHETPPARPSLDSPRTPEAAAEIRRNFFRRVSPESQHAEDYGSRRHSGISNSSTVIEAIIVTTPPQRPRKLRHVSKASSLRSEVDTNAFDSPAATSGRASFESTEMPARRLPKTRLSISDGRMQPLTPERDRRIRVTDPLLRHHKDTASLRTDAQWPSGVSRSRVAAQSVDETLSRYPTASYHRRASDALAIASPTKRISLESPSKRINYESESSSDMPFSNRAPRLAQRTELGSNQAAFNATRHATQRALENILPPFSPKSSDNESLVTVIRKRSGASIDRINGRSSTDDGLLRPRSNRRASDAGSGRSIDRGEFSTRWSIDRATLRSEDHPRHLYSQTTPFSQTSDVPEVSEATAVNIYPHNNRSLVVVEQPKIARPVAEEIEQQHNAPPPDQPLLTFQPSTPPNKPAELVENSPLTNPRNAPLPPIINVLPATPALDEADALDGANADGLQRRPSLLQRARRYSDNIIQPIIKRSTSLRRHHSHRTNQARRSEAERLHPNWRPRDFWDDNSDSESDFGDGVPGEDLGRYDRLPPGGDTSDPPLPRRLTQRLPGFRGTGGFLIGNSLGVERHGTNKRRPHVTLPANFLSQRRPLAGSGDVTAAAGASAIPVDDAHRVRKKQSLGSLRSASARQREQQGRQSARRRWRTMSLRIEYVGIGGLRERWRARQLRAHERRAEKRREEIRRSIGPKFLVQNGAV
jgi:hypothetical protein